MNRLKLRPAPVPVARRAVAARRTDEERRLAVLSALQILDTPADPVLNGLARAAATGIGCPIALVSMVDAEREWFKAKLGIDGVEAPRVGGFCATTILGDTILEVPDAWLDARFAGHALVVDEPHIRFYAGVPLRIDGQNIGTLCVIDVLPRQLDEAQRGLLVDLGRAVEHWMVGLQQQHALRAADAYRRMLFERLGDGVLLLDEQNRILDANPNVSALVGYERDELLRSGATDLLADFEHARLDLTKSRERTASRRLGEWVLVHKDGRRLSVEVNVRRLDDKCYLAVIRDITQRRARDHRLQQLSLAVAQSPEAMWVSDFNGNISYCNDAAASLFGYPGDTMIGLDVRVLRSGETPPAVYQEVYEGLAAGRAWKGVLSYRCRDGSVFPQLTAVSPIRMPDGRITHVLVSMEDIGEMERKASEAAQERLRLEHLVAERTKELGVAKRAAEAASQAKSDFLVTMSHEIRTPMNGVIGIVDVLRQSSLTPYQYDLANTISESASALLRIIEDILDFSKIEAGGLALERESVCLLKLVEGVCDALQPVASGCGVRLQLFVDPDLPDHVLTDPLRMRQILNNLIGNAIKFSSGPQRRGMVRVRVGPDGSGGIRMRIDDNGIGMTPEVCSRIFQPFVQADSSTTRRFGGTGLGLSICSKLVALFAGRIEVASVPGSGSSFTVTLPLEADRERASPPPRELRGVHCHVALEDASRADDWSAYLRAAGARVSRSTDRQSPGRASSRRRDHAVVLLADAEPGSGLPGWAATGDDEAPIATVWASVGQHRMPRLVRRGEVLMDADALHRDTLLLAVALAAGRAAPGIEVPGAAFRHALPSEDEAAAQGRLILVAEDNDINQKVIKRQLALLGLAVHVVGDGRAALEQWRTGRYGMLLTDLHMPGIDGYELTRTIRSEEPDGKRIAIVALTANALHGEVDHCLGIGMDAYLSKPVQLKDLAATISRFLPASHNPSTTGVEDAPEATCGSALPVVDETVLVQLIGDEPALHARLRADFVLAARAAAEEVRVALADSDWRRIAAVGHRLKSSCRAIGALALGACYDRLEQAAAGGDHAAIPLIASRFEIALADTVAAMSTAAAGFTLPSSGASAHAGILLVDDDPFHLQILEQQLAVLGQSRVDVCHSGRQAIEWLRFRDTSALLLLLDLNMPGMDGVEFMRHLVDRGYLGAIALISGADQRVLETASKLAGAYRLNVLGHLHKPIMKSDLQALIERWHASIPVAPRPEAKRYGRDEVRRAIDADQLLLHYQPKVSLGSGAVVGFEALVRWQHPVDGLLFPISFVPVAEAHGLIDALTGKVLAMALEQARRWRDDGLDLRVAVNISMDNLTEVDFVEFILGEVARHRLQPTDLILEITESQLMRDARVPMDILTRLRLKRVGLSIDDFGTGHSSLAQLRDIPFDELKIDRGFVHGGGDHATERAIFRASLEMAHQLGMTAVAEGVEDRADWDFAAGAGCDVAQGNFIARPMAADAVAHWTVAWQRSFVALTAAS